MCIVRTCRSFLLVLLLIAGGLSWVCPAASAAPTWYDTDWLCRQEVTVPAMGNASSLDSFPVLVKLTSQGNPLFDKAQSTGQDIFFTDSAGTKLNHEIEYYQGTGTKELDAWVRVDDPLSAAGTTLYMYYENASAGDQQQVNATWHGDFRLVQHFQESPADSTPQMKDSTTNNNHGTCSGMTGANQVPGNVDGSLSFDGVNDQVSTGPRPSLDFDVDEDFTIEAWIKTTDDWGYPAVGKYCDTNVKGYWLAVLGGKFDLRVSIADGVGAAYYTLRTDNTYNDDQWHHFVGVADRNGLGQIYVDGGAEVKQSNMSSENGDTGTGSFLMSRSNFAGTIDEVRVSGIVRGADWIAATFNNQSGDPLYALTFGDQSRLPEPATAVLFALGAGLVAMRRRRRTHA